MKYRKKPVVIDAIQYLAPDNIRDVEVFVTDNSFDFSTNHMKHFIRTLEGNMYVNHGDYIIKGVNGEFYPCKPDIFNKTYEAETGLMSFGKALELVKHGTPIAREGWNGKGMFVVYQKGYPQGIPSNKQTADAWGMVEGELFRCEPYLQIKMVNGSHAMWVPSINDVLAEDWHGVE